MAAKPIIISIVANATQARAELNRTASVTDRMGSGFRKAALPAVAALGAIGAAAKETAEAASDLNEEVSKSEQIFGKQAAGIEKFAERAEQALGQSKTAALNAASTFGIIGEAAGLSGKETAEFSKKFVTLSSDLASFNNTSPEEAVTAIGAAMRGEAEPIRKYGVLLDDATLRNRALKLGLIDSVKQALTPQQKALAASEEILKQTTKAQGDFARTSDGAANKSRILAAQSENLKAKLGEDLLPVYIEIQGAIADTVDYLSDHGKETKIVAGAVAGLSVAVLAVNAAMKVASATTAVYSAAMKVHEAAQKRATVSMVATRGGALAAGAGLLYMSQQGTLGSGTLSKVATVAGSVAAGFAIGGPFGAVIGAGGALIGLAGKSEESARRQQAFLAIQQQINGQAETLVGTLNQQTGAITELTKQSVIKSLADAGAFTAANKVGLSYNTVTQAALGNTAAQRQVNDAVAEYAFKQAQAADGMDETVSALTKAKAATDPLTVSVDTYSTRLGKAKTATDQTNRAIRQMEENAHEAAIGMRSAGSDAGRGFHTGLSGWLNPIRKLGEGIAAIVEKAARDKLKIKSPSRVFREIGEFTGEGFAQGIRDSGDQATDAIKNTISEAANAAKTGALAFSLGTDLTLAGTAATGTVIKNYNFDIRFDSNMTEVEMGRQYKKAIAAAESKGL